MGIINRVLTSREAAMKWELSPNTVTQWCNRGKFNLNEARKSEKTWLVTKAAMIRVTGRDINEEVHNRKRL